MFYNYLKSIKLSEGVEMLGHLQKPEFGREAKTYLEPSFVDEMLAGKVRGDEFLSAVHELAVFRTEKHFNCFD